MNWSELLDMELNAAYTTTEGLLDLVNDDALAWKPATGSNWMTVGQLLMHTTTSCGASFRGFASGDWGMPEGENPGRLPPEALLPPAEALPAVSNVSEAKQLLGEDKQVPGTRGA